MTPHPEPLSKDIVERLRQLVVEREARGSGATTTINPNITGWLNEAAAEIERLTAESDISDGLLADAKAEIERLRAGLQEIARRALEPKP